MCEGGPAFPHIYLARPNSYLIMKEMIEDLNIFILIQSFLITTLPVTNYPQSSSDQMTPFCPI